MSWRIIRPRMAGAQAGTRVLACIGATLCLIVTAILCARLPTFAGAGVPAIIAPLGASAVLVFAVPSSPLAQPWRVIGGNTISTLIGIATYQALSEATYAAGIAVGLAILVMSVLRCLHPPGGAAALLVVLAGPEIQAAGYAFAFAPVAANSVALVVLAMVFHRMTGHSYPHKLAIGTAEAANEREAVGFRPEDFDRALTEMHETFDIAREDLELLLSRVEHHARERQGLKSGDGWYILQSAIGRPESRADAAPPAARISPAQDDDLPKAMRKPELSKTGNITVLPAQRN